MIPNPGHRILSVDGYGRVHGMLTRLTGCVRAAEAACFLGASTGEPLSDEIAARGALECLSWMYELDVMGSC